MTQILVFAGNAQSGKSSAAKFVTGIMLKQAKILDWFEVHDETGDLYVNATKEDNKKTTGKLDLYRQDWEFQQYASEMIWPYCKIYSYATQLKNSVGQIFGLNPKNLYGSNEDKSKPTHILWKNMLRCLDDETYDKVSADDEKYNSFVTHREVMQYFGTNICRQIDPDCWTEACFGHISAEELPYVVIDDCRFENEIDAAKKYGAKVVLLTRNPLENSHASEQILNVSKEKFDYIIDNSGKYSIKTKEAEILKILEKEGWVKASI